MRLARSANAGCRGGQRHRYAARCPHTLGHEGPGEARVRSGRASGGRGTAVASARRSRRHGDRVGTAVASARRIRGARGPSLGRAEVCRSRRLALAAMTYARFRSRARHPRVRCRRIVAQLGVAAREGPPRCRARVPSPRARPPSRPRGAERELHRRHPSGRIGRRTLNERADNLGACHIGSVSVKRLPRPGRDSTRIAPL